MGNGKNGGQWETGWPGNEWDMGRMGMWEEWEMRGLGNGKNGKWEECKSSEMGDGKNGKWEEWEMERMHNG